MKPAAMANTVGAYVPTVAEKTPPKRRGERSVLPRACSTDSAPNNLPLSRFDGIRLSANEFKAGGEPAPSVMNTVIRTNMSAETLRARSTKPMLSRRNDIRAVSRSRRDDAVSMFVGWSTRVGRSESPASGLSVGELELTLVGIGAACFAK